MRIQLASDLHLEFDLPRSPARLIEPAPGADLLVLAGDIHSGIAGIEAFLGWPVPVLYVPGNHEFYGSEWRSTRQDMRAAAAGTNVYLLDNDHVVVDGVRFLGCTMWTDFLVRGTPQLTVMGNVGRGLNDYYVIKNEGARLKPEDTLADHLSSRAWLQAELAKPWPGPTVVVTHHAPHPRSIHPRYAGHRLSGGFYSDLTELLRGADLWLHGHVHDSCSYQVAGCRVVANPAGYQRLGELENDEFGSDLVIEVPA